MQKYWKHILDSSGNVGLEPLTNKTIVLKCQIDGTLLLSGNSNTTISLKDSQYTDSNSRIAFAQSSEDSLTINPDNDYPAGVSMMGCIFK